MKSGRRIAAVAAFAMVTMAAVTTAPAGAAEPFVFQSSNESNRAAGGPHVEVMSAESGNMNLKFATEVDAYALIEYRVDGVTVDIGDNWVTGDTLHPYVCVEMNQWLCTDSSPIVEQSFAAVDTVEVRLAITDHPEWSFDWTTFEADKPDPQKSGDSAVPFVKADCRKGGWSSFEFSNQGHCISYLMTSKDRL